MNQNKVDAQARRGEEAVPSRLYSTASGEDQQGYRFEGNARGRPGRRLGEAIVGVKRRGGGRLVWHDVRGVLGWGVFLSFGRTCRRTGRLAGR